MRVVPAHRDYVVRLYTDKLGVALFAGTKAECEKYRAWYLKYRRERSKVKSGKGRPKHDGED